MSPQPVVADRHASGTVRVLHPGDVACGESGDRLETLLGSCVAIVLADPRRTFGAMCHIVHSRRPVSGERASTAFAGAAMSALYATMRERGFTPSFCEAWVFGGGNMFPALVQHRHVGDDNVRWAVDTLIADGIRIVATDVGGSAYRRLAWTVGPGAPEVVAVAV